MGKPTGGIGDPAAPASPLGRLNPRLISGNPFGLSSWRERRVPTTFALFAFSILVLALKTSRGRSIVPLWSGCHTCRGLSWVASWRGWPRPDYPKRLVALRGSLICLMRRKTSPILKRSTPSAREPRAHRYLRLGSKLREWNKRRSSPHRHVACACNECANCRPRRRP